MMNYDWHIFEKLTFELEVIRSKCIYTFIYILDSYVKQVYLDIGLKKMSYNYAKFSMKQAFSKFLQMWNSKTGAHVYNLSHWAPTL